MRPLIFGFTGLLLLALLLTRAATAADLTVTITHISGPGGEVRWALFDSAEDYKAEANPVLSARSRVDGDRLRFTVHDLPAGRYAIKLYHDANANGKLDSNRLGIPTEGYGFSNNAGRFGPPPFEKAAVVLEDDLQIGIRMR